MNSESKKPWVGSLGRRTIVMVILIAVITPFWTYLLFFTNTPMIVMAGLALVIVLIFSTGTAWTAIAIPRHETESEEQAKGEQD